MERRALSQVGSCELTIAICGNPNCGKTTLFNVLTGLSQKVGNYPGVTVEKTTGSFNIENRPDLRFHLVDIPGSYSLSAFSPDEYIATQVLCGEIAGENRPDLILCVIDATNLDRGLYLLFQVVEVGCPVVVALNMVDLAERHGIKVDSLRLEELLPGVSVVPVVASKGQGIESLKSVLAKVADRPILASIGAYDEQVLQMAQELASQATGKQRTNAQYLRVLLDKGGPAESAFIESEGAGKQIVLEGFRRTIKEKYGALSVGETGPLTQRATTIAREVVSTRSGQSHTKSERIDRFLLHPVLGPTILAAIMVFMFQSVFGWAEPAMHLIGSVFASLAGYLEGVMIEGPLRSLAVDGVIGGVGSVLVFLPQIIILFFFISLLEDSGYMPRAAFLVDRLFGWCGLSGKSLVPMLSSFACAVPGIMATRTIENRKLRIMTILVAPLMSCSARLPVYTIMIAAFIPHRSYFGLFNSRGLVLTGLYTLGMVLAVLISFLLNRLLFRQERATFIMDMPSYTTPTLRSIFIRIYTRVKSFVGRAGTVILAITIVIWALSYYPRPPELAEEFDRRETAIRDRYELPQTALQTHVLESDARDELARLSLEERGAYLRDSYFGRIGRFVTPVFEPLGWDWKITMATLASFPAREVVIATLGTIYNLGTQENETSTSLIDKMQKARWEDGPQAGKPVFTPAVALSIMVFFALCAQCGATLVTIRHETAGWRYSIAAFLYMTILAYLVALVTYQIFSKVGF
jgi:ferrous iron transport protein B